MSQQTHTVTLKAVDGVSTVFQRIGQSGQTAAAQITQSGRTASAGLAQMDANAVKAGASTAKLGTAASTAARGISAIHAAASGAAFATFIGFLSDAANAAAEDEAAFTRLETAVTATGASYGTYANGLDNAITGAVRLAFADDAAADALATLTAQTQSAGKAQELLGVSMDLARGKGISLGAAATIVGKVAQGNTAILTRYGITIDENATATEALAAIQQRFSGQAEAFSNTQAGAIARVQENLDNFVESIGGALGPMQTWIALLPGVSAGMQLAGAAAGALTERYVALAVAEEAASVAGAAGVTGLAAFSAVALPLLGVAAVGVGLGLLARHIVDSGNAAETAQSPLHDLNIELITLGKNAQTATEAQFGRSIVTGLQEVQAEADAARVKLEELRQPDPSMVGQGIDKKMSVVDQVNASLAQQAKRTEELDGANQKLFLSQDQINDALSLTNDIIASGRADAPAFLSEIDDLVREFQQSGDVIAFAQAIDSTRDAFNATVPAADAATGAVRDYLAEMRDRQAVADFAATMDGATARLTAQADAIRERNALLASGVSGPEDLGFNNFTVDRTDLGATIANQQHQENLAAAEKEAADAADEATRAAQAHAQAMQDEQAAALTTADALIGSADSRAQAALRAAEAEDQYAERVSDINSGLNDTLSNLEESYGETVANIQQQRVEGEEQLAESIKGINEQRRDAAIDAENAIAEVAAQRQDIVAQANRDAQEAERQYLESQKQSAQAEADVRAQLQETTQEAAERWHEANQQNLEQQRQIRVELGQAIADVNAALHDSMEQAHLDMQRLAEDHRIAMAGFETDERRIRQDLKLVLQDPRATAEQKNAAELAARRQLHDLDDRRKAEDLQHERDVDDLQKSQAQAQIEAEQKIADVRRNARAQQQQADEARAQAQEQYQQAVSQANQQASEQLANIADQERQAADDYARRRAEIARQEQESLTDLDKKQQEILDARAQKEEELAKRRRDLIEENAKREQELDQQAAAAAQDYNEQVADAQNAAAKARMAAQEQYAKATETDMTELQRLREEGLITEGEYQKIYSDLIEVQQLSRKIEEEKELSALRQLDTQKQLLEIELAKSKAAAKGKEEPPDPLDTPPGEKVRALGGFARGRTLIGEAGSELAIRGNRMWEVGAGGPEWLTLASGTMIMPHGAAQARMRGMALGGHVTNSMPQVATGRNSRASGASIINNYGTITIKVDNADVGAEIVRQMAGRER